MLKKIRAVSTALMAVLIASSLTSCSLVDKPQYSGGSDNQPQSSLIRYTEIPEIDTFDRAMSKAHFLCAPLEEETIPDLEEEYYNYTASTDVFVDDTSAYFALGSEKGEYDQLLLLGLDVYDGQGHFSIALMDNGVVLDDLIVEEVLFPVKDNNTYSLKVTTTATLETNEDNENLVASRMQVKINGKNLGSFEVPSFSLGCVGFYKMRDDDVAYADDIKVVADYGETLFSDDFDGRFANRLYPYNYSTEATGAFSPYYFKVADPLEDGNRKLVISSGLILSETAAEPAPIFRREFEAEKKKLASAYLYLTAFGSFDAYLNGKRVNESFFDPGKMVCSDYINYVSYDVTELMEEDNTLDIALFHGFFDRAGGYPEVALRWGKRPAIKGELVLIYEDGVTKIIPTNEEFKVCTENRYRYNDIYHGEIIDDRYVVGYESVWKDVCVDEVEEWFYPVPLVQKENEPIVAVEELPLLSVTQVAPQRYVYDFGQNIAGTISFTLQNMQNDTLQEGRVVTFRFGETLNSDNMVNSDDETGTIWTANLKTARATDYYILGSDTGDEITFDHTYHGFRYVEVIGLEQPIPMEDIKALVLSSALSETGEFSCSDELINQYYSNSRYSMRSNMMDIPTDCPQRDERLGWAGDAQITSLFGMYQYNSEKFYRNYLKQLRVLQDEDGSFPDIAPLAMGFGGHSCWGDATAVITWNLYLQYGDEKILEENYEPIRKWVDYLTNNSEDYLFTSGGYGDHLALQGTPETLSDTAWCAHSAQIMSKIAAALGNMTDSEKYAFISSKFKEAWQNAYLRDDWSAEAGCIYADNESETAYSLGLEFELFPEEMREAAASRLNVLVIYNGYAFYPGYSGMGCFLPALAENGYSATAIKMLQNTNPGGLAHPIVKGLTTNPEEMGLFKTTDYDGNVYEGGKYRLSGSLNHAAFSSVCTFVYSDILGISPDADKPGYEHFFISPCYDCGLSQAGGSYECRFGRISVSWDADKKLIECSIPTDTTCTLRMPGGEEQELEPGEYKLKW